MCDFPFMSSLNLDFSVFVYFLFCLVLFYFGPLLGNVPLLEKYSSESNSRADFLDKDNYGFRSGRKNMILKTERPIVVVVSFSLSFFFFFTFFGAN